MKHTIAANGWLNAGLSGVGRVKVAGDASKGLKSDDSALLSGKEAGKPKQTLGTQPLRKRFHANFSPHFAYINR